MAITASGPVSYTDGQNHQLDETLLIEINSTTETGISLDNNTSLTLADGSSLSSDGNGRGMNIFGGSTLNLGTGFTLEATQITEGELGIALYAINGSTVSGTNMTFIIHGNESTSSPGSVIHTRTIGTQVSLGTNTTVITNNGAALYATVSSRIEATDSLYAETLNSDTVRATGGDTKEKGSFIDLGRNSTILAKGATTAGVRVSSNSEIIADKATVTSQQYMAAIAEGGGTLTMTDSDLKGKIAALGVYSQGIPDTVTVNINGGTMEATDGDAVRLGGRNVEDKDGSIADSNVTIANTTITATGNLLSNSFNNGTQNITFDRVDATNAGGIVTSSNNEGITNVTLSNGTQMSGAALQEGTGSLNLTIDNAGWNITESSNLTDLTVKNGGCLTFVYDEASGDFTDIYAANIMLESGSILQIDVDDFGSMGFKAGDTLNFFDMANGGSFTSGDSLVTISTTDNNWEIDVIFDTNGTATIQGIRSVLSIPEPSSAALVFSAVGVFMLRRRKNLRRNFIFI